MVPYPETFPMDAAILVAGAFKGKNWSDKAGLAHANWNLAGFALKSTIGAPRSGGRGITQGAALKALNGYIRERTRGSAEEDAGPPLSPQELLDLTEIVRKKLAK